MEGKTDSAGNTEIGVLVRHTGQGIQQQAAGGREELSRDIRLGMTAWSVHKSKWDPGSITGKEPH